MSDSNISKNLELQIIQEHLKLASRNILLCSNDSVITDLLSNENLQVLSNHDQILSDHIDNLIFTNTFHKNLSKYDKKFDTIIIHCLLEQIKYPELFLENLDSVLNEEGTIICTISNFFNISNIINLLSGNLFHNEFNTRFYDLDTFLFFLNKNNMHVTKLFRTKKEFSSQNINFDETLIPSELVNMIQKIPDYNTLEYIFLISKNKTNPTENLEFLSQFPKNYLIPKLYEFFEILSESKNSIRKKDTVIAGLEASIKDLTGYSGSSLTKKDTVISGLEASLKEEKDYTGSSLTKKDTVIAGLEDSVKLLCNKADYTGSSLTKKDTVISGLEASLKEQKTYTSISLKNKDKIIKGHENSIKEQQEFIENLEENIRQLESHLKKFSFWKK